MDVGSNRLRIKTLTFRVTGKKQTQSRWTLRDQLYWIITTTRTSRYIQVRELRKNKNKRPSSKATIDEAKVDDFVKAKELFCFVFLRDWCADILTSIIQVKVMLFFTFPESLAKFWCAPLVAGSILLFFSRCTELVTCTRFAAITSTGEDDGKQSYRVLTVIVLLEAHHLIDIVNFYLVLSTKLVFAFDFLRMWTTQLVSERTQNSLLFFRDNKSDGLSSVSSVSYRRTRRNSNKYTQDPDLYCFFYFPQLELRLFWINVGRCCDCKFGAGGRARVCYDIQQRQKKALKNKNNPQIIG